MVLAPQRALIAPPHKGPTSGLLAMTEKLDVPDDRWMGGFAFDPEFCGTSYGVVDMCSSVKTITAAGTTDITYTPFAVWAGDTCSTFGSPARDYNARVLNRLANCASRAVAAEFWTGSQATTSGWSNRYLADNSITDVLTTGPTSVTYALCCLEEYLSDISCGGPGMIHATPTVVTLWMGEGLLYRENDGTILTVLGTKIITDGGYDGSGPDGQAATAGNVWAYATDEVYHLTSEPQVFGGANPDGVSRSSNDLSIWAEMAAAVVTTGCRQATVSIDAPICGVGGSGS